MDKENSKNRICLVLILLIFVMGAIFYMSSRDADTSMRDSIGIDRFFASILVEGFDDMTPEQQYAESVRFDEPVRHAAHLTEFAVLGVLLSLLTSLIGLKRWQIISIFFGMAYAASDEIHQLFVAGRGCQAGDFMFDSLGVILGVICITLIYRTKETEQ